MREIRPMLPRVPVTNRNSYIRREYDNATLQQLLRYVLCAVVLAVGFVYASWQHFATTKYGYEAEKLRKERRELEAEGLRLRTQQENMLALRNMESRALAAGLQPLQRSQIDDLRNGVPQPRTPPQANKPRPARR